MNVKPDFPAFMMSDFSFENSLFLDNGGTSLPPMNSRNIPFEIERRKNQRENEFLSTRFANLKKMNLAISRMNQFMVGGNFGDREDNRDGSNNKFDSIFNDLQSNDQNKLKNAISILNTEF